MRPIFKFIVFTLLTLGMGLEGFGQNQVDPNNPKPDLREEDCTICKGNAQNYSILNVYFSDADGNPNTDICSGTGPRYISLLYTSNANSNINNFRVIADIVKKNRNDPDGEPISSVYINEFVGTISPCNSASCIVTIPIPEIQVECQNEFYELSRPLVAWTPGGGGGGNNNNNLRDGYTCNSYPAAQCLNATNSIPIEVGLLAYSFAPIFECFEQDFDRTNVSFIITSLFGGNPTQTYNASWEFEIGSETIDVDEFSPRLRDQNVGTSINAKLVITQGDLVGEEVIVDNIIVPLALTEASVISGSERNDSERDAETGEDLATGSIEVTFANGDFFYFWSSVDNPEFYSESARIEDLAAGTYKLTTFDNVTGTCRVDFFDLGARILPVELADFQVNLLNESRSAKLVWSTTKEWESSHFEVERATQGLNFEKIAEVNAAGWSNVLMDYAFEDDKLPLGGANVLYRLKQVDMNGNAHYSNVLSIRTPGVEFTTGVWRAFPNPSTNNELRISLLDRDQYDEEAITFRLVHPSAQTMAVSVRSESEMNDKLSQMVSRIPKGVFVVEIQWGQKVEHIKVLKQ
ncbi:hypothetical protein [Cecembia lonarensis]|uniref:Secretion system C-terminal sorting domain-containing protein n=1 Tax=Cecembia lonarensis (strain CCUG 58316 / KCTC 22772 / LW9) TaxID=1225176 RepID=K1LBV7_CECL9|nr:hypothetical protein [Cecembia lonarensis]EKB47803.1 hypothetical protein B879_03582 [Cecembia lonarensis LW9]